MAAVMIPAIDQDAADAHFAQLAERDFFAAGLPSRRNLFAVYIFVLSLRNGKWGSSVPWKYRVA
jgi:hypothetical protein